MPDYPDRAVLECLVNALIHRDYMIAGSEVHIDIFDDRMEIYSPGGMMDGSLVQELDTDHGSFQTPQSNNRGCVQQNELHGTPWQRIQEDQSGLPSGRQLP